MNSPYLRQCPRCSFEFSALTDRGVCPECKLFSRVSRENEPIAIIPTFEEDFKNIDWPFTPTDSFVGAAMDILANGGGRIFVAERYEGFPPVELVHRQLFATFQKLKSAFEEQVPNPDYFDLPSEPSLPDRYDDSERVLVLSWVHEDVRYFLIGYMTAEGGSIDAYIDGYPFRN